MHIYKYKEQYYCRLNQPNQDYIWLQVGVAPQCGVKDLLRIYPNTKTGRVFIPKNVTTKSFLGSHSINNYGWIFSIPNIGGPQGKGYVKARN
jgi:hypothetical protein